MTSQPTRTPDPETADLLAQAERRRVKLVALSDMGMVMSQEICTRWVDGPYHPEPRHDAGRSFASVSRSVRLSLVLEARVDAEMVALRKGVVPPVKPLAPSAAGGSAVVAVSKPAAPFREDGEGGRYRTAEGWREAFEREADGLDEEDGARGGDRERLTESEMEDELADGDFDVCVDVIRAGMGLAPLASIPPRPGEGRLGEAERGGGVGFAAAVSPAACDSDSPTPDFAALCLDPPHEGEGGLAVCGGPSFHLSQREREGPARPLARGKVRGYTASG